MGAKENGEERDDRTNDLEKDIKHGKEGESDYEPARDSLSSQGETPFNDDNKVKRASRVPKKLAKKEQLESSPRTSRGSIKHQEHGRLQFKASNSSQTKAQKPMRAAVSTKSPMNKKIENSNVSSRGSSEMSEESSDKTNEEVKEIDVMDEAPICDRSNGTDDETIEADEDALDDDKAKVYQKIEEMETRIEKLEEELREVAALEISLYSVIPEHGSSSHKVHTPARRLSRLYIHACKYWTQDKKATIAKNTVSGLVLVAKSCGNDVPRLTFWLSNTVVLRAIISQTFSNLSNFNTTRKTVASNGGGRKIDEQHILMKWKNNFNNKQGKILGIVQQTNDWQDTNTYVSALQKIESWIFSRVVESLWWQFLASLSLRFNGVLAWCYTERLFVHLLVNTMSKGVGYQCSSNNAYQELHTTLTPHMQPPEDNLCTPRSSGKLLGPALGDQHQGFFSINLWKSAFRDAFTRICPVRAGGHECGCLPVLARKVMEQCVSRLDVAMFNAILRESAHQIPTDPVSDPIVDPKVLPIPAGDLSFGSGAQLKNSIGNWSRWLSNVFGMDDDDSSREDQDQDTDGNDDREWGTQSKSFRLLNELSDLLMLPKDMLLENTVRKEVCPSIDLPLITRILCNFTPDEFCPDPVPGVVLEELNIESILDRKSSEKELIGGFPCAAAPVVYSPPLFRDVAEKVGDVGEKGELDRRASVIQRKGYTSDEDLDELDSPLAAITDKTPPVSPSPTVDGGQKERSQANSRYRLLQEVWCKDGRSSRDLLEQHHARFTRHQIRSEIKVPPGKAERHGHGSSSSPLVSSSATAIATAMLHLLAAMRRRLPRWPRRRRRLTARVFDEAALALSAPEEEAAAAAASANAAGRRWSWSGGLEVLLAVARAAPLAAASCLACRADEADAAGRRHAAELGDLVVGEAMRFVIYL
ncbi:hypothetical protein ZIOFF_023653 [Zingiber officinale]|uniref:Dilute domain-containing protein n=1 Tax=Zingiber officinale TaxID=94328 RepID=A0A8J5H169_ZINOF|nr:hypothetical protein ZIOFF_023653 [Zingiber officinale]